MVKKMNFCVVLTVVVLTGCTPIPSDYQSVSTDSSTADVVDSSEEEASTSATSGSENSLAIDEFEYNGKTISVLNDVPSILEKFGTPDKREPFQPVNTLPSFSYSYNSDKIEFNAVEVGGEELPLYISIYDENVKLPEGIHIGCTDEEIKAAYGEPSWDAWGDIYFMCYENEKCEISFNFDSETENDHKLSGIIYTNVDTSSIYYSDHKKRLSSDVDTVPASGDSANGLAGEEFLYNGKEISVLDKPHEKVIPNLGAPFRIDDLSPEGVFLYYFGSETEHIRLETYTYNGEELTKSLFINDKTIKTNKGIGVGCTTADVLAAYGDPLPPTDKNDFSMCYKFGQYEIAFHRNSKDGDIVSFAYINLDTFEKYLKD